MRTYLVLALKLIAALTVLCGALQLLKPQWVLTVVGGEITPTGNHFFGIIGLFMILFGGLLWQALFADSPQRLALFWCAMQKLGATAAVVLGYSKALFSWLALGVAGFDFLSCLLILAYWWMLRDAAGEN